MKAALPFTRQANPRRERPSLKLKSLRPNRKKMAMDKNSKKKVNFTPFARRFHESVSDTIIEQDHESGKRLPPVASLHRQSFGAVTEKRDMQLGHLHDLITQGVLQST